MSHSPQPTAHKPTAHSPRDSDADFQAVGRELAEMLDGWTPGSLLGAIGQKRGGMFVKFLGVQDSSSFEGYGGKVCRVAAFRYGVNLLLWWTAKPISLAPGTCLYIDFTVKRHQLYCGIPQTIISSVTRSWL